MHFSVIIPTFNRSDALSMTLANLAGQDFIGSWEVIVINNNCSDDTDVVVANWQSKFPVELRLLHETRPGASAARNKGARSATGDFLVFIDNDILVPSDFLTGHMIALTEYPDCWITGPTVNLPEQDEGSFGQYRKTLFPPPELGAGVTEVEGFGAANVSIPHDAFERIGGFDEHFFVASGEDRELAIRARSRGIRILSDPRLLALHNDWAGSTLRDFCRRQSVYAQSDHYFLQKSGDDFPRHDLALRNGIPNLQNDGLKLYMAKQGKRLVGSNIGQAMVIGTAGLLEKVPGGRPILWKLYRLAIAGSIFRGYQDGIKIYASRSQRDFDGGAR